MAGRAKWDLRGPARSAELHRTWVDKMDRGVVEFRPDGAITCRGPLHYGYAVEGGPIFYSAPNAAIVATIHDAAGRPAELLFHDSNGALVNASISSTTSAQPDRIL